MKCMKWIILWKIVRILWDIGWVFDYQYQNVNEFVINHLYSYNIKKWCFHIKQRLKNMRQVTIIFEKNKKFHMNNGFKYRSLKKTCNTILFRIQNFIEMHRKYYYPKWIILNSFPVL